MVVDARQRFDSSPERLADVRTLVRAFATRLAISAGVADMLVLAVSEAAANAIMHSESPSFEVHLHSQDCNLVVEVLDLGVFRRPEADPDGAGHYGFRLMGTAFDEVEIRRGTPREQGTNVRLTKRL